MSHHYLGIRYYVEGKEVSREVFEAHVDNDEDCSTCGGYGGRNPHGCPDCGTIDIEDVD